MSSTQQTITDQLTGLAKAANADDVGDRAAPLAGVTETATGWDAYEVWRRFIKEARDRRELNRDASPK